MAGYVRLSKSASIGIGVIADLLLGQAELPEKEAERFALATGTDRGFWMGEAGPLEILALLGPYAKAQAREERERCAKK